MRKLPASNAALRFRAWQRRCAKQSLVDQGFGTVYGGGVATERGYKFKTPEEAWENASAFVERCAEILSERRRGAS